MVRIMVLYSEDSSVDSRFSIGLIPKWASRISLSSLNNSCLIISEFKIKIILVLQFFLIKLRTSGLTICMSSLGPLNDVLKFLNYLAKPRKALAVWVTLNWLRPLLISLIPLIFISRSTSSGSVILISRSAEADSEADAPHVLVLRNPSISSSSLISFFRCSHGCLLRRFLLHISRRTENGRIDVWNFFVQNIVAVLILSINSCFLNRLNPLSPTFFFFFRRSTTFSLSILI